MICYLKGYYGYKNFGDELLLLGVINWLCENYGAKVVYIETKNKSWLDKWIMRNKKFINSAVKIVAVSPIIGYFRYRNLTVLGGGEVVTDARPFPYNGRNYLLYLPVLLFGKYIFLGGIGTIKKPFTRLLYKQLLGNAERVVTRDSTSNTISSKFNKNSSLFHDFGYEILKKIKPKENEKKKILINVNPYIRSQETKEKIVEYVKNNKTEEVRFFPAEIGLDDNYYGFLKESIPGLKKFDWTEHTLQETVDFFGSGVCGIGARLHFLLMLDHLGIPYEPLVYQEKITKVLGNR